LSAATFVSGGAAAALQGEVRAKLTLLRAGSREEDIMEARSRRDAAREGWRRPPGRLRYCSVDAPIDGIVLSTNVSPGQLVSTTVPVTLLTMADDSGRRVRSFVDEQNVMKPCLRQNLRVTRDGVPGMQFDAVVKSIGLAVSDNPFVNRDSIERDHPGIDLGGPNGCPLKTLSRTYQQDRS
jgi:multidrug resistance efflux pump